MDSSQKPIDVSLCSITYGFESFEEALFSSVATSLSTLLSLLGGPMKALLYDFLEELAN